MKLRTRIAAYVLAPLTAVVSVMETFGLDTGQTEPLVAALCAGLALGWFGLLLVKSKTWSWRSLIALHGLAFMLQARVVFERVSDPLLMPYSDNSLKGHLTSNVYPLAILAIPLLILLTDPPSRSAKARSR